MSKTIIPCWSGPSSTAGTGTFYFNIFEADLGSSPSTESYTQEPFPAAGVLSLLGINVNANSSGSSTIRTRIGGANGSQSVPVGSGSTGFFQDTSHTDSVSQGTLVNVQEVSGNSTFNGELTQIIFAPSSGTVSVVEAVSEANTGSTGTFYYPLMGDTGNTNTGGTFNSNEALDKSRQEIAATGAYLAIRVSTSGGTITARSRINGANGNLTVSATSVGAFEDSTHTDSITAGQDYNYSVAYTNSSAEALFVYCSLQYTGGAYSMLGLASDNEFSQSSSLTRYYGIQGYPDVAAETTEAHTQMTCSIPFVFSNLTANAQSASGTTTVNIRDTSTNTGITLPITSSGVHTDSIHTYAATSTSLMNLQIVTAGSTSVSFSVINSWASSNQNFTYTISEPSQSASESVGRLPEKKHAETETVSESIGRLPKKNIGGSITCTGGWTITGYNTPFQGDYPATPSTNVTVGGTLAGGLMYTFPNQFLTDVITNGHGLTLYGSPAWYLSTPDSGTTWTSSDGTHGTASGATAVAGITIAVDPTVIPLGTPVTIPSIPRPWNSYQYIAEDTGGGIIGKHIDVFTGIGDAAAAQADLVTGTGNTVCIAQGEAYSVSDLVTILSKKASIAEASISVSTQISGFGGGPSFVEEESKKAIKAITDTPSVTVSETVSATLKKIIIPISDSLGAFSMAISRLPIKKSAQTETPVSETIKKKDVIPIAESVVSVSEAVKKKAHHFTSDVTQSTSETVGKIHRFLRTQVEALKTKITIGPR